MSSKPPSEPRAGYLGFVAHELRNPLTTALWCAELMGRIPPEERGGARGAKLAALALRSLRRLAALAEDHLLAERFAAGGIPLKLEDVALGALLAEAGARAAPEGGLAVSVPEGLSLRADRAILAQVLEALVAAAGRGGAAVRAEAPGANGSFRLVVSGALQAPDALALPRKGALAGGVARPLGLVMAAAAAEAMGLALRVQDGALVLSWPAAGAEESPGATRP